MLLARRDRDPFKQQSGATVASALTSDANGAQIERSAASLQPAEAPIARTQGLFVDIREHKAGAGTSPDGPLGKLGYVGLETWHERDPADPGLVGPVLDNATAAACSLVACTQLGR